MMMNTSSPSAISRKRGKTKTVVIDTRMSSRHSKVLNRVSESGLDWHVDEDRKSFLEAALRGAPGVTLRRLFLPRILLKFEQVKRQRIMGNRYTKGGSVYTAVLPNAVKALHQALSTAAQDVSSDPFSLEYKDLLEALDGEMSARCCFGGTVLTYPNESPESMMVHVLMSGAVSVTTLRSRTGDDALSYTSPSDLLSDGATKSGAPTADPSRRRSLLKDPTQNMKMYYTTNEIIYVPAALGNTAAAGGGRNVATGEQGREVVRMREVSATPYAVGAAEALGLSQFADEVVTVRRVTNTQSSNAAGTGFADLFSIRLTRLHSILQALAARQYREQREKRAKGKTMTVASLKDASQLAELSGMENSPGNKRSGNATLRDHIFMARKQALTRSYPMNELLLRQSWLLQDLPYQIVRSFLGVIRPMSVEAGGVIVPSGKATFPRLYFLRRGSALLVHVAKNDNAPHNRSRHSLKAFEVIEDELLEEGTTFGELTVLFGEPRSAAVVAKTPCDLWYLPRSAVTRALRTDDESRKRLMNMAAALRCKWLGEQRYSESMLQLIRNSSPLFNQLPSPLLHLMQGRLVPVVHSPGTLVTTISTKCDCMLFIVNGQLHSITEGVASFGDGEVIGEACLLRHRWPFALTARRMVEGWILHRKDWVDILQKAEVLVAHSGECSLRVPALLKSVFGSDNYAKTTDLAGRAQMPVVKVPVPGVSFYQYVKQNSIVTLRALCLRFKAVVKWSDIICSTVDMGEAVHIPRGGCSSNSQNTVAIPTSSAPNGGEVTDAPGKGPQASHLTGEATGANSIPSQTHERRDTSLQVHAGTEEVALAASAADDSTPRKKKPSKEGGKRKSKRALGEAFLFLLKREQTTKSVADMRCSTDANHAQDAGMRIVQQLLNREATASSARREAGIRRARSFKETGKISWQSRSATQLSTSDLPAEKSWSKTLHSLFSSKETNNLKGMEVAFAARDRRIAENGPAAPRRSVSQPPSSAVQGYAAQHGGTPQNRGNVRDGYMSVMEAVQRGFAYQFAGEDTIQTCVSHHDPDVTVGLPSHQRMRKLLFTTPTNQIQKLGIIFASSQLLGKNAKTGINSSASARGARRAGDVPIPSDEYESHPSSSSGADRARDANNAKQSERAKALTAVLLQAKRVVPTNTSMTSVSVSTTPRNIHSASLRPPIYPPDNAGDVPHMTPLETAMSNRVSFSSFKQPVPGFSEFSTSSFAGITATERSTGIDSPAENAVNQTTAAPTYQRDPVDEDAFTTPDQSTQVMEDLENHQMEADLVSSSRCSQTPRKGSDTSTGKQDALPDDERPVTPRDFAMPDAGEAEQLIRRLQRNVKGVNRLAKALRMERLQQASLGDASFATPTNKLARRKLSVDIENLQSQASEPLGHVTITHEWAADGGTDYIASDLSLLIPQSRHTKARLIASPPPRPLFGIPKEVDGVEARLTACPVGGKKFSYVQHPLVGPKSYMTEEEYTDWVSTRNDFLARCAASR